MSFIAAALLLNMDEFEAWICLCNLLDSQILTTFYTLDLDLIQTYLDTFSALFEELLPNLYRHLEVRLNISPHVYFFDWVLTLFTKSMPIESAARIFDIFLLEGESFVFRAGLGVLSYLQNRLLIADFDESMHTLQQITNEAVDDMKLFSAIQNIDVTEKKYCAVLSRIKKTKNVKKASIT